MYLKLLLRKYRFKFSLWLDEMEMWIKTWHNELVCFEVDLSEFKMVCERLAQKDIVIVQTRIKGNNSLIWVLAKHEEFVKKLVNEF